MQPPHNPDTLLEYLHDELAPEERREIEAHLAGCDRCRTFVQFNMDFDQALRDLYANVRTAEEEACPADEMLIGLADGTLDPETAKQARRHLLYCKSCRDDFFMLERMAIPVVNVDLRVTSGLVHCLNPPEDQEFENLPVRLVHGERSAPLRVAQLLFDSTGVKSLVGLRLEHTGRLMITVTAECEKATDWMLRLHELVVPLHSPETQVGRLNCNSRRKHVIQIFRVGNDTGEDLGEFKISAKYFSKEEARDAVAMCNECGDHERAKMIAESTALRSSFRQDFDQPHARRPIKNPD